MPIQALGHEPATVLYVEDHPVNVLLMQAVFERRPGLGLVVATTGAEALDVAAGLEPALLLLDLRLPDCHGSELLTRLRRVPSCRQVAAVAVTANDDFELAGTEFVELWAKPLDLKHVLERLDALTADPAQAQQSPDGITAGWLSKADPDCREPARAPA